MNRFAVTSMENWHLRHWQATCAGILLAFGLLLYSGTLNYPFVELDDPLLLTENPSAQSLSWENTKTVFSSYDPELYIPLTFVSYQIDGTLGGLDPFIFRLHSLLQHVLNGWLFVLVCYALTRKKSLSLLAGLLFLVHPIQTEAVVWVSGRKDLLSTTFFLLSLLLYLRFTRREDWMSYGGSVVMFLLGLLAKVSIISLAPLLLVIDVIVGKRLRRRTLIEKMPFVALAVLFGVIALYGKFDAAPASLLSRILVSCTSLVFSLWKILLPVNLSPIYAEAGAVTISTPIFFVPLFLIVSGIILGFLYRKKYPAVVLGATAIVLTYAPSFGNILKGGEYYLTTDRYAYVPMTVIALLAALGLERLRQTLHEKVITTVTIVLIVAFSILTLQQVDRWKDPLTLSAYVVETAPDARIGRLWRGNVLRDDGQFEAALEEYRIALTIIDDAQVHYNRGLTYQLQDKPDDAIADYRRALELQPVYPLAEINLGEQLYLKGKKDEARALFETAASQAPQLAMPLYNLGVLEGEARRFDRAAEFYQQALERDPAFGDARANLAIALLALGKTAEAVEELKTTLQMDPENPTALGVLQRLIKEGVITTGK